MAMNASKEYRQYIERIERLEEERKSLADDIADLFKELKSRGYDKDATKIVLKIRRTGLDEYRERSATVDLYLGALEGGEARAPARTREIIEKFDAETGEITSSVQPPAEKKGAANAKSAERTAEYPDSVIDRRRLDGSQQAESQPPQKHQNAPAESAADEISATISHQRPPSSPAAVEPEAVPPPPASGSPIPLIRKTAKDWRPHCLNPDLCAASGLDHCHRCKKAMAADEVAA